MKILRPRMGIAGEAVLYYNIFYILFHTYNEALTCSSTRQAGTSGTIVSMATKKTTTKAIVNRRARYDYELGDELVAGIVLTGPETRAARDGHVQLKGAFVTIRGNELWLNNASFSLRLNKAGDPSARAIDDTPRKLLASRKQIDQLIAKKTAGLTIIPTKLLTTGKFIKLVIALGKGKKNYDKRQALKKRAESRDIARELKQR